MSPKATIIAVCILSLVLGPIEAQTSSEIEAKLNKIFSTESQNSEPMDGKSCGPNIECIPHQLCDKKGNVIRSGKSGIQKRSIIDIQAQGECSYLEVCCSVGNKLVSTTPIPPGPEGCGYRNPNGVGFSITGDKEGESRFGKFPWMMAILSDEVIGGESFIVYMYGAL